MRQNILIMRFSAMGDVAMTVPVVASLASQYPDLKITVVSRKFAQSFFEGLAPNVAFVAVDFKKGLKSIGHLVSLYWRLRSKGVTAVADLHDVLRSKFIRTLFSLSGIPTAHVDKHRNQRRQLIRYGAGEGIVKDGKELSAEERNSRALPPMFDNYAEVFAHLGFPVSLDFAGLNLNKESLLSESQNQCDEQRHSTGIVKNANERWIGIAPFAAHKGKILPSDTVKALIDRLSAIDNLRILLFSGRGEERLKVEQWAKENARCVDASGNAKSLREELVIMSQLDVMISMDSANQHLASLVAVPVVSIWGATHISAGFSGWNQRSEDAVGLPLACRPCSIYGNKECRYGDYACLRGITVDDIMAKLDKYL